MHKLALGEMHSPSLQRCEYKQENANSQQIALRGFKSDMKPDKIAPRRQILCFHTLQLLNTRVNHVSEFWHHLRQRFAAAKQCVNEYVAGIIAKLQNVLSNFFIYLQTDLNLSK